MAQNNSETVKFTAPTQLKQRLQELADDRHLSLAALVRLILTEYLKRHE